MGTLSGHKAHMLSLYKTLIRASKKFPTYNFRMYFLKKVRDEFRENKSLTDKAKIKEKVQYAQDNLETIRRQAAIAHLYGGEKIVVEQ